jgi:chromosome segregation ATPase
MKRTCIAISVLSIAALVSGCDRADHSSDVERQQDDAAGRYQEARDEIGEAGRAVGSYTEAQKTAFVAQMEQQVAALKRETNDLRASIANSTDDVKANAAQRLDDLQRRANQLEGQLNEVRNATAANWEAVKAGFETAYNETRQSFDEARQWLSQQIAPNQG